MNFYGLWRRSIREGVGEPVTYSGMFQSMFNAGEKPNGKHYQ